MELPEQDRQALIEAARRRGQGGAAFGVYPSSGKRPEKLNVSRDVNMPAQVARGWVAGTLGLPGDIEGLGRMALGLAGADVSETPVLPTSDFYREYLPGYDPAPAAKFASGLGALTGGLGSTKLAGAAVKGAKATGRALGPKAAEMAEGYLQRSGLAPTVVKPKGGNWLSGNVERATERLKTIQLDENNNLITPESVTPEMVSRNPDLAVNNWIDTKLNKYIRNEMATPEDPVRKLAERGILHFEPEAMPRYMDDVWAMREKTGFPAMQGTSPLAQKWEAYADQMVRAKQLGEPIRSDKPLGLTMKDYIASEPGGEWALKAPDEQMVYELRRPGTSSSQIVADELGLPHLIDELRNATRADSDLPANLRWKPEDLKKVTMEQAVERVAKINDWRAAQMEAAKKAAREGIPVHKEYEGGFQWMAAPDTAKDPKSLKYIQDVGCESGWCTQGESLARQYGGGGNQLYVLHDPNGKSVVQISVRPQAAKQGFVGNQRPSEADYYRLQEEWLEGNRVGTIDPNLTFAQWWRAKEDIPEPDLPPEIVEIKGRQNRPPKEEHLPMVQDFVRSGNWSRVGDFKNTGLIEVGEKSAVGQMLKQAGETNIPPYVTRQEYDQIIERFGLRPGFGLPQGYAKGGLVQDTDAIAAKLTGMDKDKALTHALRMANAKQEAHMAAGGLAKVLKGAKAASAAKPAQIGSYQALPLQLPRAPNLPPQELTKTAERVARQQMGEHVRKSATEAQNLAGRSMKEAERLKQLNIKLQPTKEIPTPAVVPEEIGQVRIALPGDISVADKTLMSIDDMPIGAPQEGGPMYGAGKQDLEDARFWASNEGPAQIFQNKVTDLANLYETPEVLAQHLAMGHDAMNFAQHFADANLLAIQASKVKAKDAKEFDRIIKEGFEKINPKTKERVRITFPDFPGIRNYEEAYKATQENPELRKWFNNRMKVEKITGPLGLPSGKEVEYAIMEPALSNIEHSMTGLSVGRMKPGASLIPGSEHKTYSHDIAGQALGRTKELTPIELAFPDASAYIRGTKRPQDFTPTIQKLFPHQVVDDQYINQLGEYYNRLKQIRGYKKGGAVKKSGLSVLNKAII